MKPLEKANLPQAKVKLAAVSEGAAAVKDKLYSLGIETLGIKPCAAISDGTAAHADLHLLHMGGGELYISREQEGSAARLSQLGFSVKVLPQPLGAKYPADVPLNAAVAGDTVIYCPKTVFDGISFADRTAIHTRQGYSKCSVCAVRENAFITDDTGIFSALKSRELDALLIEKGDVRLLGRPYGFIGGCCGLIDKNTLLFNGSLAYHRNAGEIEAFLKNYGVTALSIGDFPLTDIGGILPLCE